MRASQQSGLAGPLANPTVRLALQALMLFFIQRYLYVRLPLLTVAITVFAGLVAVTAYLLRYRRAPLVKCYRHTACRWFIDLVCRWTREQPPLTEPCADSDNSPSPTVPPPCPPQTPAKPGARPSSTTELLATDGLDFELLRDNLADVVRGFDNNIGTAVGRIRQNMRLRTDRTNQVADAPLGVFLIVGPEGVGKRHFAQQLARGLYRSAGITSIDLRRTADAADSVDSVLGFDDRSDGTLIRAVRTQPCQVLLLEHVDCASPELLNRLRGVLLNGFLRDERNGHTIAFSNCVIVLTTTLGTEALARLEVDDAEGSGAHRQTADVLAAATRLPKPFLAQVHDILSLQPPPPPQMAEVVALVMEQECDRHRLLLRYVAATIIADEVLALDREHGYAPLRARVRRRLRDPIDRARQAGAAHLTLLDT